MIGLVQRFVQPLAGRVSLPVAGGVVAALFSLVFQSPGVVLSPDGWAYWEGSVSLLAGDGYRYLDGAPIVAWPPGFSVYLALWQLVLGSSAATLAVAHAAAIGLAAGLWIAAARRFYPAQPLRPPLVALAILLAFVIPICLREVLSESLFMVWLGAALYVATDRRREEEDGAAGRASAVRRAALFALLAAALLLTRHVGIAYLPALLWIYWRSIPLRDVRARLPALLAAALAACVWLVGRVWLGLLDNNPRLAIDGNASEAVVENVVDNVTALVSCWLPRSPAWLTAIAVGFSLLLLVPGLGGQGARGARSGAAPAGIPGIFTATALAGGVAAATWALHGVSGRRIVLPVAALLMLAAGQVSAQAKRRVTRHFANAVLIVLAVVQLARAGYWVRYAASSGPEGLDWGQTPTRPCFAGEDCRRQANEIVPPDVP